MRWQETSGTPSAMTPIHLWVGKLKVECVFSLGEHMFCVCVRVLCFAPCRTREFAGAELVRNNGRMTVGKSTLNCKETGFQCPQSTLPMGLIIVLSHLELAQIRILCLGWPQAGPQAVAGH